MGHEYEMREKGSRGGTTVPKYGGGTFKNFLWLSETVRGGYTELPRATCVLMNLSSEVMSESANRREGAAVALVAVGVGLGGG